MNSKIKELVCTFLHDKKYNGFLYNTLLAFLCIFAFFAPDYVLKLGGASKVQNEWVFTISFFVFGLVLSMVKSKKVVFSVVAVFFVFEAIQLHYMAYFGKPITPSEINKIFTETGDIAQTGFSYFFAVWYVFPAMLISYGIYIYFFNKYSDRCFKTRIAYIILVIVLLVKPERAYRKTLKSFLPGPTRNSIHNTLNTYSYFFVKELWSDNRQIDIPFKEYRIEKIENFEGPDVVIFLVVESMNYSHLGLYGYGRDTTPNLDRLKNNGNFLYRKALSSSVSTSSALPFLFNIIREPGNFKLLFSKNNNLIKLAKNGGYSTYFFTSQESKTLNDLGVEFLDKLVTRDSNIVEFADEKDDVLLRYLDDTLRSSRGDKKFISIFQRNLHTPYENNYEEHGRRFEVYNIRQKNRKDYLVNAYDNAVLFEDYFILEVINRINNLEKSAILIVTSDHGQMLGEDGVYGHNVMDYRVAEVPFMVYYNGRYRRTFDGKNIPENISHYEISKFIAGILGYKVVNPNEDGKFFVQGNNIYADNFIIPYSRDGKDELKFEKITSTYNYFK